MPDKTPKRPRDMNQWTKRMVDIATMDETELAALRKKLARPDNPKNGTQKPGKRGRSA
jgi:hypothetical protein